MDATNTSEQSAVAAVAADRSAGASAKFQPPPPSSLFAAAPADPNGTRAEFDDSLADLTFNFNKPTLFAAHNQQSPFPQEPAAAKTATPFARGTPASVQKTPAREPEQQKPAAVPEIPKTPVIPPVTPVQHAPLQQTPAHESRGRETFVGKISVGGTPAQLVMTARPPTSAAKTPACAPQTPVLPPSAQQNASALHRTPAFVQKSATPAPQTAVEKSPASVQLSAVSKSPETAPVTFEDSLHSVLLSETQPPTPRAPVAQSVDSSAAIPMDTTESTQQEASEKPIDALFHEISAMELETAQEKTLEITMPFLPDVDMQSVVFEVSSSVRFDRGWGLKLEDRSRSFRRFLLPKAIG